MSGKGASESGEDDVRQPVNRYRWVVDAGYPRIRHRRFQSLGDRKSSFGSRVAAVALEKCRGLVSESEETA